MCTGRREEASRLRCEQEKCWSSAMQYGRLTLAVFEKGLLGCNNPMCTLSQNGYGDQSAKARKYTCLLHLKKCSFTCAGGEETRFRGYGRSRRALVVRDARCDNAIDGMAVSDQDGYKSDHTLSFSCAPPNTWQSRRNNMCKS